MKRLLLIATILIGLVSCAQERSPYDKGSVEYLPSGEYIIWNTGSRHIVKCVDTNGYYYWLNDGYFQQNGIPGYDAHEYHEKTRITIK
jgi:hypothetical protein